MVEATGVELSSVLRTRKLLILGTATRAKKAPLPDPLYVYCTKMLFVIGLLAVSRPQLVSHKCRVIARIHPVCSRRLPQAHRRASLYVLGGRGFCSFTVPDLLSGELASANAATPSRGRSSRHYSYRLMVGAPGSYQFTTTVWALSLNHKPLCHEDEFATHPKANCWDGSY
jgi:hypothetical protein